MKKWYQSKTVIVNLLTLGVTLFTAMQGSELIAQNASLVAFLGMVVSGVNIALRLVTSLPIGNEGTTDADTSVK